MGDTGGRVAATSRCVHGDNTLKYQVLWELLHNMSETNLAIGKECLEIATLDTEPKSKYENAELIQREVIRETLKENPEKLTS